MSDEEIKDLAEGLREDGELSLHEHAADALEQLLRERASLRLERDAVEHNRLRDNAELIRQRDEVLRQVPDKTAIILTPNPPTWGYAVWDEEEKQWFGLVGFQSADDAMNYLRPSKWRKQAQEVIDDIRRKLAIAGVEGSPPPGVDTTISKLMVRCMAAEKEDRDELRQRLAEADDVISRL